MKNWKSPDVPKPFVLWKCFKFPEIETWKRLEWKKLPNFGEKCLEDMIMRKTLLLLQSFLKRNPWFFSCLTLDLLFHYLLCWTNKLEQLFDIRWTQYQNLNFTPQAFIENTFQLLFNISVHESQQNFAHFVLEFITIIFHFHIRNNKVLIFNFKVNYYPNLQWSTQFLNELDFVRTSHYSR